MGRVDAVARRCLSCAPPAGLLAALAVLRRLRFLLLGAASPVASRTALADHWMADPARLDALRQQFAANPRRYFAPLASALRRAGDPQAAATLTRAQLAEYPEHLTGHVILGQALADAGDRAGARAAFERAHAVDPGNTVALEALVTMARHAGDDRAATHWVALLREADPEHAAAVAAPAAFEPLDLDAFGADDPDAFDAGTLEPAAEVFEVSPVAVPPVAVDASSAALLDPAAPTDPRSPTDAAMSAPGSAAVSDGTLPDAAPSAEDGARDGLLDPVVGLDVPPADPVPAPMREALANLFAAADPDDDAADGRGDVPEADAGDAPPPATPFITETMAGLLLTQGHPAQALDVYVQLLAQRPGDERLRTRVAALRGEALAAADFPQAMVGAPVAAAAPGEASATAAHEERAARMWRAAFAPRPRELAEAGTTGVDAAVPLGGAPDVLAFDPPGAPFGDPSILAMPEPAGEFERWAARVDRAAATYLTATTADAALAPGAASAGAALRAEATPASLPADDPDDDLAQFTAWLRGLAE